MSRIHVVALSLLMSVACDGPAATQPPPGGTPTNTTEFHISVMNACMNDVLVKLVPPTGGGREQLLIQNQRDTITGTNETVHLMGAGGETLATYRPVQGKQKVTVSSDCSALSAD